MFLCFISNFLLVCSIGWVPICYVIGASALLQTSQFMLISHWLSIISLAGKQHENVIKFWILLLPDMFCCYMKIISRINSLKNTTYIRSWISNIIMTYTGFWILEFSSNQDSDLCKVSNKWDCHHVTLKLHTAWWFQIYPWQYVSPFILSLYHWQNIQFEIMLS